MEPIRNNQQLEIYRPPRIPQSSLPNKYTLLNSSCVTASLACIYLEASLKTFSAVNLPFRLLMLKNSIGEKKYGKTAFNIAAYSLLFFPQYRMFAIGLDCISSAVNHYQNKKPEEAKSILKNQLNPKNFEDACKILGVTSEEARNAGLILEKLSTIVRKLDTKKLRTEAKSKFMAHQLQLLIDRADTAYRTLQDRL